MQICTKIVHAIARVLLSVFRIASLLFLFIGTVLANGELPDTLKVAYFSQDVPGIVPLSPAFDPDSYAVITQIFDSLVYFDLDGHIKPGLATDWEKLTPTRWRFNLRPNVKFHNGEPFDGGAVKFTYDYVLRPENRAGNAWILNTIQRIVVDDNNPLQITIETHKPDPMFLNRLNMFGSICPPAYIRKHGIEYFMEHPIGTGPYQFVEWIREKKIVLKKNPMYWRRGEPIIDNLEFTIMPEREWGDALLRGEVHLIPNFAGNQTRALMAKGSSELKFEKRLVLSGYWVLLKNNGILADRNIRRAINYAVNKDDLVQYADLGNAEPLASLGKRGEFGRDETLTPYAYRPKEARKIISELAPELLKLKAIASDIAAPVAKIIQAQLKDVGIDVELIIVSRSEWANKVVGHKIKTGERADYDLAINLVDNPIHDLAFHAGLFLHSKSPWSLLKDDKFDAQFEHVSQASNRAEYKARLQALDRYIHDEALMLFTTQRIQTVALSKRLSIPSVGLNGHLDYEILTRAKFSD